MLTSLLSGEHPTTPKLSLSYFRLAVYRQSVLPTSPLRPTTSSFFFIWTLAVIVLMQLPLWREDGSVVYNCCWSSTSAVILGSESRGTHDHILLSQIREPPTWRAWSPYLYSPRTGWHSYTPRNWVAFSSPPTTHRATVEVFESASTPKHCSAYDLSARTV
jgi:hypothetical protein